MPAARSRVEGRLHLSVQVAAAHAASRRLLLDAGETRSVHAGVPPAGVPMHPSHQYPSAFHQMPPMTAKISNSTTHITKPTRHQVPIVTYPLPKMIGEVPVA